MADPPAVNLGTRWRRSAAQSAALDFAGGCQYFADEIVNLFVYRDGRAAQAIADVEDRSEVDGFTVTAIPDVGDDAVSYRRRTDPATDVVVEHGDRGIWLQVTAGEVETLELARLAIGRL